MSQAVVSRTIKFSSKAGTYTAEIMSKNGDLYQEYTEDSSSPSSEITVYPDFSKNHPELAFVCSSSRAINGFANVSQLRVFFNGQEVEFGMDGVSKNALFAGYFKLVKPDVTSDFYRLQILKNIVILSNFASAVIRMEGSVINGDSVDTIQSSYNILIKKSSGDSYRVTIKSGDNNYFVISKSGGSCVLEAVVSMAGAEINDGLSYQWDELTPSGWTTIQAETKKTLTVTDERIATYGNFKVTVSKGGEVLGSDEQNVMDVSDANEILANPVPLDETISDDKDGNKKVTYTPKMVKRGTTAEISGVRFKFLPRDAAGNLLDKVENTQMAKTTYDVTLDMCQQAGGDVSLTIFAE